MRTAMEQIIARHTGKDEEQVRRDVERDKFFTAEEAKEYGLVDEVLTTIKRNDREVGRPNWRTQVVRGTRAMAVHKPQRQAPRRYRLGLRQAGWAGHAPRAGSGRRRWRQGKGVSGWHAWAMAVIC